MNGFATSLMSIRDDDDNDNDDDADDTDTDDDVADTCRSVFTGGPVGSTTAVSSDVIAISSSKDCVLAEAPTEPFRSRLARPASASASRTGTRTRLNLPSTVFALGRRFDRKASAFAQWVPHSKSTGIDCVRARFPTGLYPGV